MKEKELLKILKEEFKKYPMRELQEQFLQLSPENTKLFHETMKNFHKEYKVKS